MKMIRIAALTCCAIALVASPPAAAQESASQYPSRPVTFVVPFAPGGVTGLFARILGQKLELRLGKPFIVEHKPGGGGVTGALTVSTAPRRTATPS